MKIVTIASLKGGVGKTTLAIFLAQALAARGKKVLAVDLDPNNNLSDYFLRDEDSDKIEQANVWHILTRKAEPSKATFKTDFGVEIIPCTPALHRIGIELAGDPRALLRVRPTLQRLEYDYILLDTPPALTFEFRVGLEAADLILSPVALSRWTIQALALMREEIANADDRKIELRAVPSMLTASEEERVRSVKIGSPFTRTGISKAAAVRSAANKGKPLHPKSKSYDQFKLLAGEI